MKGAAHAPFFMPLFWVPPPPHKIWERTDELEKPFNYNRLKNNKKYIFRVLESHSHQAHISAMSSTAAAPPKHTDIPVKGIIYAAAAYGLLAIMNMLAKVLAENHHIIEIAFYRNLVSVIPFLAFILITRQYQLFKTQKPKALAARSVIGTISLVTTFTAFTMLPMAETTVLLFTTTLIVPALGFFILGERVGPHRWGAIIIGFLGVLLIVGLKGFSGTWLGIGIAISAALMHASLGLLLRFMKTESPVTVTFYFVLTGMFLTGVCMPFIASAPTGFELSLLIATGIAGGLAQFCLAGALKNAPIAVTAPLNYTGLIWATGFDIMIWSVIPGWPVFLGAAIVMSANLYVLYREHVNAKKTHNLPVDLA